MYLEVCSFGTSRVKKEGFNSFYVRYSTLLHLPPLRFHGVGGCWDQTQELFTTKRKILGTYCKYCKFRTPIV
jgi:hypothetical protein